MFSSPLRFNESAAPAQVIAARRKAAGAAAHAWLGARKALGEARNTLAAERAAEAEVEREFAGLAHPGVDDASIDAYHRRKERLATKRDGYRALIAAAEENVRVAEAAETEACAALIKARAEMRAPIVDTLGDLPRLKAEAEKATQAADKERAALERAQREGEPARAALKAVMDEGAEAAQAEHIFEAADKAEAAIAAAREALDLAEEFESTAHRRVEGLEAERDRQQRVAKFNLRRDRVEARRDKMIAAIAGANEAAIEMAGLFPTCKSAIKAYNSQLNADVIRRGVGGGVPVEQILLWEPRFLKNAAVPHLGREGYFIVSGGAWHDYAQFEVSQPLLASLREFLKDGRAWPRAALDVFAAEYQRRGLRILEFYAILFLWRREIAEMFAEAGDVAKDQPRPHWPLQFGTGGDYLPWRHTSLPALRPGAPPLWEPHWPGERLLELTRQDPAATAAA